MEDEEPDYFKDMAPTIRKTQKVGSCLFGMPYFSSHLSIEM